MSDLKAIFNMKTLFVFALLAMIFSIAIANWINEDTAILVGNYIYIPIGIVFVTVSIIALVRFGFEGSIHGLAWMAFAGFAVSWFIGNNVWTLEELFFEEEPYPSAADLFYLIGYPFLLMFLVQYLVPMRMAITKNMVFASLISSVAILGLFLYVLEYSDNSELLFVDAFSLAYPLADIFVLFPSIIGLILFFRGKTNFMWSMILFGIVLTTLGDLWFMYLQVYQEEFYHTGHPVEILFLSSYVFMIFGVYNHIKTFAK